MVPCMPLTFFELRHGIFREAIHVLPIGWQSAMRVTSMADAMCFV